jgi:hydrogenase maturation protease
MTPRRVLVAGIGNIFFGDDGFGVEVVRRLRECGLPDGVDIVDFGIRGLDLTYALLDSYAVAILVDALPRGGQPGTLYVLEPDVATSDTPCIETHGMEPMKVLRLANALVGRLPVLRIVGCEPTPPEEVAEMAMGLSPAVAAAVTEAVHVVEALVTQLQEAVEAGA